MCALGVLFLVGGALLSSTLLLRLRPRYGGKARPSCLSVLSACVCAVVVVVSGACGVAGGGVSSCVLALKARAASGDSKSVAQFYGSSAAHTTKRPQPPLSIDLSSRSSSCKIRLPTAPAPKKRSGPSSSLQSDANAKFRFIRLCKSNAYSRTGRVCMYLLLSLFSVERSGFTNKNNDAEGRDTTAGRGSGPRTRRMESPKRKKKKEKREVCASTAHCVAAAQCLNCDVSVLCAIAPVEDVLSAVFSTASK